MENAKHTICVITRYRETDFSWLPNLIRFVDKVIIYNKGENDILINNDKVSIINLPNVGRIDHTIAYHITSNWDNLSDNIVFIPASIYLCRNKGRYLDAICKRINTVNHYKGFYGPRFYRVNSTYNYSIDDYQAEGNCNKNGNKFIKSTFKDLQEWKNALIDTRPIRYIAMRGMFIVNKENIKYIDKQIYINLLESLSVGDNIENGHFAERIWAHLFRQYSFDKLK